MNHLTSTLSRFLLLDRDRDLKAQRVDFCLFALTLPIVLLLIWGA